LCICFAAKSNYHMPPPVKMPQYELTHLDISKLVSLTNRVGVERRELLKEERK
jgi:hypothetical protein